MQWIEQSEMEGAYGFPYQISLGQSRRGYWWVEIGGFRWSGNEGGYKECRFRLSDEDAAKVRALLQRERTDDMLTLGDVGEQIMCMVTVEA